MYLAFKIIHLLGVVLFLGNIIVTAVWKTLADQTREPRTIAYAQRLVSVTDWMVTLMALFSSSLAAMAWSPLLDWILLARHRKGLRCLRFLVRESKNDDLQLLR
jgi:uncharacterized membrane protein